MSSDATPLRLRSPEVPWREVDGQVVVLDPGSWQYVGLGGSARTLWPLIAEGASPQELVAALCATYDVEPAQAAQDVERFVARLRELELLEP